MACSTVTVRKCQAALRTLQAFPFFRPTCLCREPHVDPDCNSFQNFLFDHPCVYVLKKGKFRTSKIISSFRALRKAVATSSDRVYATADKIFPPTRVASRRAARREITDSREREIARFSSWIAAGDDRGNQLRSI